MTINDFSIGTLDRNLHKGRRESALSIIGKFILVLVILAMGVVITSIV